MQRMQREEGAYESGAPDRAGHLFEHDKQQDSTRQMKENVGQVMSGWTQPKKLAIQHVRESG
jgi:hypothetical protein